MEIANSLHITPVKGKPLSPFISKLKLLLSDEKYRKAIRWSESGGAILITDGEAFKRQVLDESAEMFKNQKFYELCEAAQPVRFSKSSCQRERRPVEKYGI